MSRVKHATPSDVIAAVKRIAKTQHERARILGWSVRHQRRIEHGDIADQVLHFLRAGVLIVAPDSELAHETNDDTKGADDDSHPC